MVPGGGDLGWSPRTLRRWRERYETHGYGGLFDRRRLRPSGRRLPPGQLEALLQLYRARYRGFNVRHFHEIACREHGVTLSYSTAKQGLQQAGLVKKQRVRGRHRRRREPRACFGELLHLDGSVHPWLALAPEARPCLILVSDDATKRVLHAAFYPTESQQAVMRSLAAVVRTEGLPMALYTDRAGWAFYTPKAKGPVDKTRLTQVGRALARLGIEHIPSYSPQARGRSERLNRTVQNRLVNELRVAGVTTCAAANACLAAHYVPQHNATFAVPPRDPPRRLCRWARQTWTPSSVSKWSVSWPATTPSASARASCNWPPSPVAAAVPDSVSPSDSISTGT